GRRATGVRAARVRRARRGCASSPLPGPRRTRRGGPARRCGVPAGRSAGRCRGQARSREAWERGDARGTARRGRQAARDRAAAARALEPLQGHLADANPAIAAAAAEFIGLTGSPQAVALLLPLVHHDSEFVREAALIGLAEAGGREISRPAMPALKDESVSVRL